MKNANANAEKEAKLISMFFLSVSTIIISFGFFAAFGDVIIMIIKGAPSCY